MKEPQKFALISDEDGCSLMSHTNGDWIKYSNYQKVTGAIETTHKNNPYPDDIFIEPTKEQWKAMSKCLQENGFIPDAFFSSHGRKIWNNCLDDLVKKIEEE